MINKVATINLRPEKAILTAEWTERNGTKIGRESLGEAKRKNEKETNIVIYTDGSCDPNTGNGGYAYIVKDPDDKSFYFEGSGSEKNTTNNRMEMTGFLEAIAYINNKFSSDRPIRIYSDSKYLIDGSTKWVKSWRKNGWKKSDKKDVKNRDLWEQIDACMQKRKISFTWVKGHNNNYYNEKADELAVKARSA